MENKYVFTTKRNNFGAHLYFADSKTILHITIEARSNVIDNYTSLRTLISGSLCRPEISSYEVSTINYPVDNKGVDHDEGGWPIDVNHRDEDQVARFKKKVEKDESFTSIVKQQSDIVEVSVLENVSVDIYEEYFTKEKLALISGISYMRSIAVYKDYCSDSTIRTVEHISWSADSRKIAVSYVQRENSIRDEDAIITSKNLFDACIWDIDNSMDPYCILKPDYFVTCFSFSPRDVDILVGGFSNGQIALWDISKDNSTAIVITHSETCHNGPITDIQWLSTKIGTEFISVSEDAKVMSWDTKDMLEPTEVFVLFPYKKDVSITCLEYDASMPYNFMVGTDDGDIICYDRRPSETDRIISRFCSGKGPVLAIERNDFFPKIFLSVSTSMVMVWCEDYVNSPLLCLISYSTYITHALWCPSRPSVIFQSKTDGVLEIWDILFKRHKPVLTYKMENFPVTCIRLSYEDDKGSRKMACGLSNGAVYLLEISKNQIISNKNDRNYFSSVMEMEAKREKLLEPKSREQRIAEQSLAKKLVNLAKEIEIEILRDWDAVEQGPELYEEMEKLEFLTCFLNKRDLIEDEYRRAKQLNVSEEYGEDEFLLTLEIEISTNEVMEKLLRKVTKDVESDTSRFPLKTISVESEYGEKKFLKELRAYGLVKNLRSTEDTISGFDDSSSSRSSQSENTKETIKMFKNIFKKK